MNRRLLCASVALLLLILWPGLGRAAEPLRRVALFPFDLYTVAPDAAGLREEVLRDLSAELLRTKLFTLVPREQLRALVGDQRLTDAVARAAGKEAGASVAITGSVTEFGERLSVDVKLFDVAAGRPLPGVFVQGRGRENLGAILVQLRQDILARIATEQRIVRIEVKGNRRIEANAINQGLKSVPGEILSDTDLAADLKTIYKLGYFDDVAVEVADVSEGKVVTFVVQEKPTIAEVVIRGNKAVKRDDIEGAMAVRAKQTMNPERVLADVEKIKTLYDSKGFYNAEVRSEVEKAGERDVRLVIRIVENEKLFIRQITFEGNRAFTTKELKNMMSTSEKGLFSFFTDSGVLKKDQLKQDVGKISAFYLNHGFINVRVGEPELTFDPSGIHIKIPISEGRQFRVGKVEMTGDELAKPRADLMAKLRITKKDFFDREALLKDIDALTEACNDEGYAYADVSPRTVPREETQTVDVTYEIKKGGLVYFNRVYISGNTKTRDKVIRRELTLAEGDLYSRTKLRESYMALNRLRYFEEIDFQTEKGGSDTQTDVLIRVKEKATGMFSIGVGYSALDHAIVTGQISQQNLFGRGQILALKASLGGSSQLYDISFTEPWLFDMPLWSKFDLWNLYREYDTFNHDSKGFGATFGYPLWEKVVGYLGYRFSINHVRDIKSGASYYVRRQEGETTSSGVTLSLTRDTTDDMMLPTRGSKNTVSVEYTGGPFMGNVSYTRYGASSSWFFPLPFDTVFGARGRIGYMQPNEGKEVPIFERYFLGGINSLRGLRDVGPRDPTTNDVIGGLTMLNFNAEYIFTLVKNAGMKGVVFFDTGNTWESGFPVGDMRKTAGAGVRWYSPIGPLRLEWGYVLDRKESEAASQWEFTIGMFM